MLDLMKFCNFDQGYGETMRKPWSTGKYSYATNGHILVRVLRRDEIPEREDAPPLYNVSHLFFKEPRTWLPAPVVSPQKPKECELCGGTGSVFYCPECDGEGDLEFENKYSRYTVTCDTCEGSRVVSKVVGAGDDGSKKRCDSCAGLGSRQDHKSVPIGDLYFSDVYLSWIAELPGAEIGLYCLGNPARFRFDGGEGLLMPRCKDDEDRWV
ncbi:MAG: hypothetical protein KKH22_02395 [Proteobacteria bacterium]|nr:hypothetical protein [Pseudomonadota bacterium]